MYVNKYIYMFIYIFIQERRPAPFAGALPVGLTLHVEYAKQSINYGILFKRSLCYEYSNLEYVHIHVMCRVNQAEYVIRIRVAASHEYVEIYLTSRGLT